MDANTGVFRKYWKYYDSAMNKHPDMRFPQRSSKTGILRSTHTRPNVQKRATTASLDIWMLTCDGTGEGVLYADMFIENGVLCSIIFPGPETEA